MTVLPATGATTAAPATTPPGGDPILEPDRHPARTLAVAAVTAVVVTAVGLAISHGAFDIGADEALNRYRTGTVETLADSLYLGLEPVFSILLTVVVTGLVWARRRSVYPAAAFAGVVAGTWVPSAIVKLVVQRPRPSAALLSHPWTPALADASFPSGHTVFVTSFVIALAMLARRSRWFGPVVVLGALAVVVMATSLVLDGVHYPSDVAASVVWSLAVAPAARLVWVDLVLPRLTVLRRWDAPTRR